MLNVTDVFITIYWAVGVAPTSSGGDIMSIDAVRFKDSAGSVLTIPTSVEMLQDITHSYVATMSGRNPMSALHNGNVGVYTNNSLYNTSLNRFFRIRWPLGAPTDVASIEFLSAQNSPTDAFITIALKADGAYNLYPTQRWGTFRASAIYGFVGAMAGPFHRNVVFDTSLPPVNVDEFHFGGENPVPDEVGDAYLCIIPKDTQADKVDATLAVRALGGYGPNRLYYPERLPDGRYVLYNLLPQDYSVFVASDDSTVDDAPTAVRVRAQPR